MMRAIFVVGLEDVLLYGRPDMNVAHDIHRRMQRAAGNFGATTVAGADHAPVAEAR
jgi:hypothetical protein